LQQDAEVILTALKESYENPAIRQWIDEEWCATLHRAAAALDAEAARLEREAVPPQKYDDHAVARELDRTAQGEAYHGNALYVAKSHPVATDDDRQMLDRWLTGRSVGEFATPDRLALQELAVRIRDSEYHTRLERPAAPAPNPSETPNSSHPFCSACGIRVRVEDGNARRP